jgi:hypothetical protein
MILIIFFYRHIIRKLERNGRAINIGSGKKERGQHRNWI